jgi:hypothetical protein
MDTPYNQYCVDLVEGEVVYDLPYSSLALAACSLMNFPIRLRILSERFYKDTPVIRDLGSSPLPSRATFSLTESMFQRRSLLEIDDKKSVGAVRKRVPQLAKCSDIARVISNSPT